MRFHLFVAAVSLLLLTVVVAAAAAVDTDLAEDVGGPTHFTAPPTTLPPSMPLSVAQQDALTQLFTSTGGRTSWKHTDGWDNVTAYERVCSYVYGIFCDGYGNIFQISLEQNGLVGTMPTYWGFFYLFPYLRVVIFTHNLGLTGTIPAFPTSHPLITLEVGSCSLSGTIPDSIFTPELLNFDCSNNLDIHGQIPTSVGNAPRLQNFVVGTNHLSGGVPDAICVAELNQIDISDNHLSDTLPRCIGTKMRYSMRIFNIAGNWFSMDFQKEWCNFENLRQIFLQDNTNLGGRLPDECTWPHLTHLIIENTRISGPFPTQVFSMTGMNTLILSLSHFDGTVPDRFDELPYLQTVGLNGIGPSFQYTWRGPMPTTLFRHPGIVTLTIQYTHFNGTLPKFSPGLTQISKVTIASNVKLTSTGRDFPVELLYIWQTPTPNGQNRTMYIPNNNLGGLLPDVTYRICNLSQELDAVNFQFNNWIGYIPLSLLDWVPRPSQPQMLFGCNYLFAPIIPALQPLVGNKYGFDWTVVGSTPGSVPRHHGLARMSVQQARTGPFCVFDSYKDQFRYMCSFCYAPTSAQQASGTGADFCANNSNVQAWTYATINTTTCSFECPVPGGGLLRRGTNMVRIAYHGKNSAYNATITQDLSNMGTAIQIYEDQPPVYNMTPNAGRFEGCTTVSVFGKFFSNLPNPHLVIGAADALARNETAQPNAIYTLRGNIKSDEEIEFVIPFAGGSVQNASVTFYNQTRLNESLLVQLYPAGANRAEDPFVIVTRTPTRGDLNYTFRHANCRTPLVQCRHGIKDPERCPTPMCRCSSNGLCRLVNITLNLTASSTVAPSTTVEPSSTASAETTTTTAKPHEQQQKRDAAAMVASSQQQQQQQQPRPPQVESPPQAVLSNMAMRYFLSSSGTAGEGDLASFTGERRHAAVALGDPATTSTTTTTASLLPPGAQDDGGYVLLNITEYECVCLHGYNGSMCQFCDAGYWGADCNACDCDHGRCDDGMAGNGKCACDAWYWIGSRCQLNIVLIVGSVVGGVVLGYAVYKIRKEWPNIRTWWYGTCCVMWWARRKERIARQNEERERLRKQLLPYLQGDEIPKPDRGDDDDDDDGRDSRADDFRDENATNTTNSRPRLGGGPKTASTPNSRANLLAHGGSGNYGGISNVANRYADDDNDDSPGAAGAAAEVRSNRSSRSNRSARSARGAAGTGRIVRDDNDGDTMAVADAITGPLGRLANAYDSSDDDK